MSTTKEIEAAARRALKKWLKMIYETPALRARIWRKDAKKQAVPFHVDLTLCTAAKMAKINQTYRSKNEPTDILSFPVVEWFQLQGYLGDLVICTPVLLKQAKVIGHSWKMELNVLLVHGLLHLLGFDHETSVQDADEMKKWEKKLLGNKVKGLVVFPRGHESRAK